MVVAAAGVACGSPDSPPATASGSPAAPGTPSALPGQISTGGLTHDLEALAQIAAANGNSRAMGTAGYDASASYVEHALRADGWTVAADAFDAPAFLDPGGSTVRIATPGASGMTFGPGDVAPLIYAPPGRVAAPIVALGTGSGGGAPAPPGAHPVAIGPASVPGCQVADYPPSVRGAVVMVWSGDCYRRAQVLAAQQAGAVGFIAANAAFAAGEVRRSTLIMPAGLTIPAVAVSLPAAQALVAGAGAGAAVTLDARATTEVRPTRSVLAELPGSEPGKIVILGAHLDSVIDGPGINDNGSGVAALLAVARALAAGPRPHATVRLAFWSGEEVGLIGSGRWIAGRSASGGETIVAYLNADMVGSPNGFAGVELDDGAPPGASAVADLLRVALASEGVTSERVSLVGSSDGTPFERAGIPVAGLFTGALEPVTDAEARASGSHADQPADACYHLACDGLANVDAARAASMARALAVATLRLADDPSIADR